MNNYAVFYEQQNRRESRDGLVGFEGLGYFSGSLENGNWSSESRGEFSPVQITNVGANNLLALKSAYLNVLS